jgi:hypothetical protein
MAESEEEAPKFLVRGADGDLWLIKKDATPEKVHSKQPDLQPQDPALVKILTDTEKLLEDHFVSANPGVKLGLIRLDF